MSLHETVLGGGLIVVRSKFKPGDVVTDDKHERTIKSVGIDDNEAIYRTTAGTIMVSIVDADFHLARRPISYTNVYDAGPAGTFRTRVGADRNAAEGRIAVLTIYDDLSTTIVDTRGEP